MKFNSKYTDDDKEITPAQYLAELVCERIAKKDGKTLPVKFWNTDRWKKIFLQQLLAANTLLKVYHPIAIIRALRTQKTSYSLRAKWLLDTIEKEQKNLLVEQKQLDNLKKYHEDLVTEIKNNKPREAFTQHKSSLDRLRELE
jgi:hypothetical protein